VKQDPKNPSVSVVAHVRPRALRPVAAAAYLGTTPFHIEELWRDGVLPFKIVGGARVVPVEDLDAYFDSLPKRAGVLPGRGKNFKVAA